METILAIAFGWSINIQGGEADELTEAATTFFAQSEEGKVVSKDVLITLTSKLLSETPRLYPKYIITCSTHR